MSELNRDEIRKQVEILGKGNKAKKAPPPPPMANRLFAYNKLHAFLGGETYSFNLAKEKFKEDLAAYQKAEEAKVEELRRMGGRIKYYTNEAQTEFVEVTPDIGLIREKYPIVLGLLDRCQDFYQVEALARSFFDDSRVPIWEEVEDRGRAIKASFNFYGMYKAFRECTGKRSHG